MLLTYSLATNFTGISQAQCARNAEKQSADFARKISNAVLYRIDYPKTLAGKMGRTASLNARLRPLLSHADREDGTQACTLALLQCGALERGKMTLADWKIAFRETRLALRIDRNAKRGQSDTANPIDLMSEAEAEFLTASTRKPYHLARRKAIARKVRYLRSQVFASYQADIKRSRVSAFKKQLAVSRFVSSLYSSNSQGFAEILERAESESALRVTIKRFRDYCEIGEVAMTEAALAGVKARKVEFKSFADLFAVCD